MTIRNMIVLQIVIGVLGYTFTQVHSACSPPTLKPGSTWISSPNCNGAYTSGNLRCHCWGHCGYICDKISGSGSNSTTTTKTASTKPSTTTSKPCNHPTPPGSTVSLKPNCVGATSNSTYRCHCWGFCALICDPI